MDQPTLKRWCILGGLLGVTLLLVWNTPSDDANLAVVQPKRTTPQRTVDQEYASVSTTQFRLAARSPAGEEIIDLFTPDLPPKPKNASLSNQPVAPTAPPVPFTFVGKMTEEGHDKIFLQEGETLHTVTAGDVVARNYKILGIENGVVTVLYLPLNITQTIREGATRQPPRINPINMNE